MARVGVAIISDGQPWEINRAIIRRMKAEIVRCRTPKGFGFNPEQLQDICDDGIDTVVLCTEDAVVHPTQVESEIVDRGFHDVLKRNPSVQAVVELGNEHTVAGVNTWTHRYDALQTLITLKPKLALPNLRWSVSMPTTLGATIDLLARDEFGCILDHVDVLCVHKYAWYDLRTDGGGGEWDAIIEYLLTHTDKRLVVTEAGIDDRATPKAEKARRYIAWAESLSKRVDGVCYWGIGEWSQNPSYEIDAAMADVLSSRAVPPAVPPQPQPEPEPTMPYTGNSLIHSTGKASAATIDAWMARKGQQLAPNYAPDKTYRQPPPIGEAIVRLSREVGVNSDLVAAQICKESAGWQSRIVRDKNNPSGLGAVNNNSYPGAITFDTPEAGIKATIAHLLTYTKGRSNPWWNLDPRASAVPKQNLGIVRTLSDLDGRWAWPGDGYGAGIATLANDLVQSQPEQEQPMSLIEVIGQRIRAHGIEVHDIRGRMPTRGSYSRYSGPYPTHTAVHYTAVRREPTSLEAEINSWVGHARYHVSSQGWPGIAYTIGISMSGRVFLLGEAEQWRYHVFNDNVRAFPISHDMTLGQEPTPAMLKSLQAVLTVLHEETPEFPNLVRATTYGHQEFGRIAGGDTRNLSTNCPGGLLPFVQQYRAGAPIVETPKPPECVTFPETGFSVCHGFLRFWQEHGGLAVFGYPITNEMQEAGADGTVRTVQYFERARFEWHPGEWPEKYDVLLGHLGHEVWKYRHEIDRLNQRIKELEAA